MDQFCGIKCEHRKSVIVQFLGTFTLTEYFNFFYCILLLHYILETNVVLYTALHSLGNSCYLYCIYLYFFYNIRYFYTTDVLMVDFHFYPDNILTEL